MSTTTIVDPTGVEESIDINIPKNAVITDDTAEKITTLLKFFITLMAESVGRITSADISRDPTRFIPSTIINAITTAIIVLYLSASIPEALTNVSSNVTANSLLYIRIKIVITTIDIIKLIHTSVEERVRIDIAPKRVLQTSPVTFAEVE